MLDLEIRQHLIDYLTEKVTIQEFQEWFVPATWDIDQTDNQSAKDLANDIELALAEFTSGHLDEEELHRELLPLAQNVRMVIGNVSCGVLLVTAERDPSQIFQVSPPVMEVGYKSTEPGLASSTHPVEIC
ncbi:MAG: hypothetical protein KF868_11060 [Acidobacteria bacterium]|nr:hypothetical protein [Acidobacteriota bacterium]MCW5969847.1 hypothetical protein [Blastocatellales bacterium]